MTTVLITDRGSEAVPAPGADRAVVLAVGLTADALAPLGAALPDDCALVAAPTGGAALDCVASHPADLVVLDLALSDMDGLELCRRLKAEPDGETMPIIVVASDPAPDDESRALALGVVDFLTRPIAPALLALRIANQLKLKRSADRLRHQALVDDTTGLPNRRWFETTLDREWFRAMRARVPLSLVVVALDEGVMPTVADESGARVAQAMRAVLQRSADFIARYGARRFAALLPQTDPPGVRHVARLIDAAIAIDRGITIGTATCFPHGDQDPVTLLRLADEALRAPIPAGA